MDKCDKAEEMFHYRLVKSTLFFTELQKAQ